RQASRQRIIDFGAPAMGADGAALHWPSLRLPVALNEAGEQVLALPRAPLLLIERNHVGVELGNPERHQTRLDPDYLIAKVVQFVVASRSGVDHGDLTGDPHLGRAQ